MSLGDLLANPLLRLRKADTLRIPKKKSPPDFAALPALEPGAVHEWFFETPGGGNSPRWHPPLTLLGALAVHGGSRGSIVWIGRSCWPTLKLLHDLHGRGDSAAALLEVARRCLFIDPRTPKERFWVIEEVLRCAGIHAVVADGSGMSPTISRRLQLAAEAGGVSGLIARPPREAQEPSWAMTRWRVRTVVAGAVGPRWEITAGEGAWNAQHQWTVEYEVCDGKGALRVLAGVGCGSAAPQPQSRSHSA